MDRVKNISKKYLQPIALCGLIYSISALYSFLFIVNTAIMYFKNSKNFWTTKKRPLPPKCLDDPSYGNHSYIQLQYIKLHYVEAGDKEKPLMIMLHGFPEFWYSWRHQIKEFSKDYWTVAVDMRGYGYSEKPQGSKYYKLKYLTDDVKNLIEALGRKQCVLLGHDWGGVVAWNFIAWYPEMVQKYVIINAPPPSVFKKLLRSSFTQFKMSWYIFFYQMPCLPELSFMIKDMNVLKRFFVGSKKNPVLDEEDFEAYKFILGKPGALTPIINYYRANFTFERTKKPEITGDGPKGFLIFGQNDIALDAQTMVEKSRTLIPSLKTELVPLGHFAHEDDPELINNLIKDFLDTL